VSIVLVATTIGGLVGPNLAAPMGDLARALGVPYLTGPFLLAAAVYGVAALVLLVWLRPDPLLLAHDEPPAEDNGVRRRSGVLAGGLIMVVAQLVMLGVMTMTPVHMHDHGHGAAASGFVIAVHFGAMFLPSPLTGWLVDRYGRLVMAVASLVTLLAAGILAATAPYDSVTLLTVALALLGLGWNFGLVTGTAILTDSVPLATRARTQGMADVAISIAGASGGAVSGVVVAASSFPVLALAGAAVSLALVPAIAALARGR
jgi:MFS family permease